MFAMWYWDEHYLPTTYPLAQHYPLGERYFCSVLAQTYPNRRFLFCGTSSGLTATNDYAFTVPAANGTIFNQLLEHNVSWRDYVQPTGPALEGSALIVPEFSLSPGCTSRMVPIGRFFSDAANGALPSFSFIDPNYDVISEENPQDIQAGERFVAQVVNALTQSRLWHETAFFLTWDEHGGYYDHVPPPRAIKPDNIAPITAPEALTIRASHWRRAASIATASGCRCSWSRPGQRPTTSRGLFRTTPRSSRSWSASGICLRSRSATPTPSR